MLWQCFEVQDFSLHANILNLPGQIKFSIMYCNVVSWSKVDTENWFCPNRFVSDKMHSYEGLVWYIWMERF